MHFSVCRRQSNSDDLLLRVQRVLQHELRTDSSLFLGDDVPDCGGGEGGACSDAPPAHSDAPPPNSEAPPRSPRHLALSGDQSPWRSRSCPCSPKSVARTRHKDTELHGASKRQSVHYRSNKFSLSGSLLAIHRQASNSLRSSASKNNSLHNSLKMKKRRSICSIDEEDGSSVLSDEEIAENSSSQGAVVKKPIHVSHSMPTLKLPRIAMPHCNEEIVTEEDSDSSHSHHDNSECTIGSTVAQFHLADSDPAPSGAMGLLPDLIPECRDLRMVENRNPKEGFINLGFDGQSESTDAPDDDGDHFVVQVKDEDHEASRYVPSPIHGMSVGYVTASVGDVAGFDVPAPNIPGQQLPQFSQPSSSSMFFNPNHQQQSKCEPHSQQAFTDSKVTLDESTEGETSDTGSSYSNVTTAPCTPSRSPSALRVRVMDQHPYTPSQNTLKAIQSVDPKQHLQLPASRPGVKRADSTAPADHDQQHIFEAQKNLITASDNSSMKQGESTNPQKGQIQDLHKEADNKNPETGQLPDRRKEGWRPPAPPPPPAEVEEEISGNLTQARSLVYWWQQEPDTEPEFCPKHGQCSEKVRNKRIGLYIFKY